MRSLLVSSLVAASLLACSKGSEVARPGVVDAATAEAAPDAAPPAAKTLGLFGPPLPAAPKRWTSLAPKRVITPPKGTAGRLVATESAVVSIGSDAYALYRLGDTEPKVVPMKAPTWFKETYVSGDTLVLVVSGRITGYDAATLATRWSVATPNLSVEAANVVPGVPDVLVFSGTTTKELPHVEAIDTKTGKSLWSKPPLEGAYHDRHLVAGGTRVVCTSASKFVAYDARTGAELWSRPVEEERLKLVAGDAKTLVLARDTESLAVILDAATGKELARTDFEKPNPNSARLDGSALFAVDRYGPKRKVVALDLERHALAWAAASPGIDTAIRSPADESKPPPPWGGDIFGEEVFVDDDAVYHPGAEALHAFERSTGALRWSWPLLGDRVAVVHGPPFTLYAMDRTGKLVVFEEGTASPEHATIAGRLVHEGQPVTEAKVFVGDTPAPTDADGRFRATYDGLGYVRIVTATPPSPKTGCKLRAQTILALEGKGTYDVQLEAEEDCPAAPYGAPGFGPGMRPRDGGVERGRPGRRDGGAPAKR